MPRARLAGGQAQHAILAARKRVEQILRAGIERIVKAGGCAQLRARLPCRPRRAPRSGRALRSARRKPRAATGRPRPAPLARRRLHAERRESPRLSLDDEILAIDERAVYVEQDEFHERVSAASVCPGFARRAAILRASSTLIIAHESGPGSIGASRPTNRRGGVARKIYRRGHDMHSPPRKLDLQHDGMSRIFMQRHCGDRRKNRTASQGGRNVLRSSREKPGAFLAHLVADRGARRLFARHRRPASRRDDQRAVAGDRLRLRLSRRLPLLQQVHRRKGARPRRFAPHARRSPQ